MKLICGTPLQLYLNFVPVEISPSRSMDKKAVKTIGILDNHKSGSNIFTLSNIDQKIVTLNQESMCNQYRPKNELKNKMKNNWKIEPKN